MANKYHVAAADRRRYGGRVYHSRTEMLRAVELDGLRRAGQVRCWIGQPAFSLGCPENRYRADFLVIWADGRVTVEDVKGAETREFRRVRRLWGAYGPLPLRILRRRGDRWSAEIVPGGAEGPPAAGLAELGGPAVADIECTAGWGVKVVRSRPEC